MLRAMTPSSTRAPLRASLRACAAALLPRPPALPACVVAEHASGAVRAPPAPRPAQVLPPPPSGPGRGVAPRAPTCCP
ncbi:hypothetical protein Y5A_025280, partial [Burkholderia glumae AU6208]